MNFYILLLLFRLLHIVFTQNVERLRSQERVDLHNELNREMRNHICCTNNMRCCKKREAKPDVKVRAILARCPNLGCEGDTLQRRFRKPLYKVREDNLKQFQGFDKDEPLTHSDIINCNKKMILTLKIACQESRANHSEYVVIDHAYDPVTNKQQKLLIPYVIKYQLGPVTQMYGMKRFHTVNSHAQEEIFNKDMLNYTGCSTKYPRPTCGTIKYKGKVVPYSEGFCCSCDAQKNAQRQPENLNDYNENFISYSDPAFLLDGIECPKHLKGPKSITIRENEELSNFLHTAPQVMEHHRTNPKVIERNYSQIKDYNRVIPNNMLEYISDLDSFNKNYYLKEPMEYIDNAEDYNLKKAHIYKRQVEAGGEQKRGGQNCADRYTPKGVNPETYHESAHCLRFSDVWYTVNRLEAPIIERTITLQIYEKHENMKGCTFWKDVTRCKKVTLGIHQRKYLDEKRTISIKYTSKFGKLDPSTFALDYRTALFLVPEELKNIDARKHPEICAGPSEYLIVHVSQISLEGDQCNIAGVGFEAFFKQPNRCGRPRESCLANQPYHLWLHDHQAEKLNKQGCFFLKFYGKLPPNPIQKLKRTGQKFLVLKYPKSFSSTVDFEIKADFNTVLRDTTSAVITEVYVDSTCPSKTIITVKITNSGLVSGAFMTRLSDCPLEMPASFNNIESKPALIPPQHQHVFKLKIKYVLPSDRFHCSIEALNNKHELVAIRRVLIQRLDRCICTWHCLCACLSSLEGLKCIPMSLQQHHAAGFQGSFPIVTHVVQYRFIDEILSFFMYLFIFLILVLLLLGMCKALIGILCSPVIGTLGLDVILDLPKPIKRYYEMELVERAVVYDKQGWPIHPDTKERVRSVAHSTEFCMNVLFFFAYPINVFILIMKKIFLCPTTEEEFESSYASTGAQSSEFVIFRIIRALFNKMFSKGHHPPVLRTASSDCFCECSEDRSSESVVYVGHLNYESHAFMLLSTLPEEDYTTSTSTSSDES